MHELERSTVTDRISVLPRMPDDVSDFCAQNEISDAIQTAILLARKHFAAMDVRSFEVVDDPEYGEQYVGIHVDVEGRPEAIFQQSKAYLESFLSSVDSRKRGLVNLVYHSREK